MTACDWVGAKAVALAVIISGVFLLPLWPVSQAVAGVENSICADCHDELSEAFGKTPHGVYFSEDSRRAGGNCQACHGDGTAHVEDGDPELIYNPANGVPNDGKSTCLSCHRGGGFSDWEFSAHSSAEMNCAQCHTVHGDFSQSLVKRAPELCYDCHSDVRAAGYLPSHHPVAEGKMSCLDCHDPHGAQADFALDGSTKELCFSCHADKEGPFVYEHAPVVEDCQLCHVPHGSTADNLLAQAEPTLCLSCHSMHFHATVEGVDGEFDSPQEPSRAGVSTPDAWKRGFLTKCTQCHTEIHGSDLPAQSVSGQGSALTR